MDGLADEMIQEEVEASKLEREYIKRALLEREQNTAEAQSTQLSEVDRLRAENLHLRAINATHAHNEALREVQTAAQKAQQHQEAVQEAHQALARFKQELVERYNIDFNKVQIEEGTGKFLQKE